MFHEEEKRCYNSNGKLITSNIYILRNNKYARVDNKRRPDFQNNLINADINGFDKSKIINPFPTGKDEKFFSTTVLHKGTIILRYGNEGGRFTAPIGTTYEQLSLPYIKELMEYNEYRVIGECKVHTCCLVLQGYAAAGFDVIGGGFQYMHEDSITNLLKNKVLERVDINEWYIGK